MRHVTGPRQQPVGLHPQRTPSTAAADSYFIPSHRRQHHIDPNLSVPQLRSADSPRRRLVGRDAASWGHLNHSSLLDERGEELYSAQHDHATIAMMLAKDALRVHEATRRNPETMSSGGGGCHHSYVEQFVDACIAHQVPDSIIAQHALYMIHSMQDGIHLFSELHRHRQNEAELEHEVDALTLELIKSRDAQRHHHVSSPPPRRIDAGDDSHPLHTNNVADHTTQTLGISAMSSPPQSTRHALHTQRTQPPVTDSVDMSPISAADRFRFRPPPPPQASGVNADATLFASPDALSQAPVVVAGAGMHNAPTDEDSDTDGNVSRRLELVSAHGDDDDDAAREEEYHFPTTSSKMRYFHRHDNNSQKDVSHRVASTSKASTSSEANARRKSGSSREQQRLQDIAKAAATSRRRPAAPAAATHRRNSSTPATFTAAAATVAAALSAPTKTPAPVLRSAMIEYNHRSRQRASDATKSLRIIAPASDVSSIHNEEQLPSPPRSPARAQPSPGEVIYTQRRTIPNASSTIAPTPRLQRPGGHASRGVQPVASFRLDRRESQSQLVERLSTPKKISDAAPTGSFASTATLGGDGGRNGAPATLASTVAPSSDGHSLRSQSNLSAPASPLQLPRRGPITNTTYVPATSSGVDVNCFAKRGAGSQNPGSRSGSSVHSVLGRGLSSTAPSSPWLAPSTGNEQSGFAVRSINESTKTKGYDALASSPPLAADGPRRVSMAIDESPLIVPRRRRGAAAVPATLAASEILPMPPQRSFSTTTTSASTTIVGYATVSPPRSFSSERKSVALADDATQADGPRTSSTAAGEEGWLDYIPRPRGSIGSVTLTPPQTESPKLVRYLEETRQALSQLQTTLSNRHRRGGGGDDERSSSYQHEPSRQQQLRELPYAEDARMVVVKREGSPLRWQKRDAPSHTSTTTVVRHDDSDEDCLSELSSSSGAEDTNDIGAAMASSRRRVLFTGEQRMLPPTW